MARKPRATSPKVKRFNLELPQAAFDRIREIESITEAASVSEVLRRSLKLYDFLVRQQQDGKEVVIRDGESENVLHLFE